MDAKTRLLSEAMEEYGFTWEDTAQRFRNAKLADMFDELFAKTDILKTAEIDYSTILQRQAGDYSELVQAAIRTGTEIPNAMRPVLEDLVNMGLLVDANGVAFTDLADVTWAKTLTQGFDQVTDAIHELTRALTGVGETASRSAAQATSGFAKIREAADDAYDAVTAVSLGHSPGGIKEIPIQLARALDHAAVFRGAFVNQMVAAERAVNQMMAEFKTPELGKGLQPAPTYKLPDLGTGLAPEGFSGVPKLPNLGTGLVPEGWQAQPIPALDFSNGLYGQAFLDDQIRRALAQERERLAASTVNIGTFNISAQGNFADTPQGRQDLADQVAIALEREMRLRGRRAES
jgi:hypothetical protein